MLDTVSSDEGSPSELIFPISASDNKLLTDMSSKLLEFADLSFGLVTVSSGKSTDLCTSLPFDLVHTPVAGFLGKSGFLLTAASASFFPFACTILLPA